MSDSEPAEAGRRRRLRWLVWVVVTAGVALLACHEFLSVYVVSGVSMEPTLHDGQRVLVLKRLYQVSRGDLLVFKSPIDPDEILIKRVLALPGQEIEAQQGKVYVGDFEMAEPYVKPGTSLGSLVPSRVPEDHYFVLGDNRAESVDSRRFDAIDRRLVVGKVLGPLP